MPIQGLASYQIQDADKEIASFDLNFVNTSNLLTDILLFLSANVTPKLDLVTDGAIRKIRLTLLIALPGGLKSAPTAGAENERTGLFTCALANTQKSFGIDVPAFASAKFAAGSILAADAAVASFETLLSGVAGADNCYVTDDKGNEVIAVRKARKTFRKHRKALARA